MKSLSAEYVQTLGGSVVSASPKEGVHDRTPELHPVFEALTTDGCGRVHILCAEPGMGKTTLISRALEERASGGAKTRFEDLMSLGHAEVLARLSELLRWSRKRIAEGNAVVLGFDNVPPSDEAEADLLVRSFRSMVASGITLILGMLPEGETLVEQYGEATCFWSYDLRMPRPSDAGEALIFDEYARGVPALAGALARISPEGMRRVMSDPGYLQAYASVVEESLRPGIMNDERRLRAALLLFGHGSFSEVTACVGSVEAELWRMLARDAPLFGIDVASRTFCCAGADVPDGLAPVYGRLQSIVSAWPNMVVEIVEHLARRDDYARAATVSLMCESAVDRSRLAFEWAAEFVNAGELGVVTDALECVRKKGVLGMEGFDEADAIVWSLTRPVGHVLEKFASTFPNACSAGREAQTAAIGVACRALLAKVAWPEDMPPHGRENPIANALMLHGNVVHLIANGRLDEAYTLLIDVPSRLETTTLVTTLLEMDFVLCSLLMGIVPSPNDRDALRRSRELIEQMGLAGLAGAHDALLPLGVLLGGRKPAITTFEAQVHHASRMGDSLLHGAYLLAAAVLDVRTGAFVRAHVRFGQARKQFTAAQATFFTKVAHLLDICVRLQLSERVTRAEITSCRGSGRSLGKVVAVLLAAVSSKRTSGRPMGSGRWDLSDCPREMHWIMNIITSDFGQLSQKVRDVLPTVWSEALQKGAADVDALADELANTVPVLPSPNVDLTLLPVLEEQRVSNELMGKRIAIRMLGGMEVRVDNRIVGNNSLERRRARTMLAFLAAIPGHVAKRFAIMESVWPEYDYETANRCVYSATTVLRTEMSRMLGDVDGPTVVASNKTDRTLSLNAALIVCDVDLFEERARKVLDSEGDDRLIVSLCRELEDLYRGGLFVPPTDGAGIVAARARELRDLYSDAMIAGAQAARRIELKMLACRFAKRAHEADDIREDAMSTLLSALCEAGRHVEAEQLYEQYVSHVVDVTRRPPSRNMRKEVSTFSHRGLEKGKSKSRAGRREANRKQAEIIEVRLAPPAEQLSFNLGDLAAG
ncbi:MAG: hypothetical protein IKG21_01805 [Atopobiaceae bacterium]|nr:hypothetical protein [Atopobiaceae bacterium]